ncbi:RNA polymerase sigma factor [Oceanisphaera pacifica]|uniref:RNA polymerase sigma factor n=1 Tax=Oceanisphaera pacifica TaxID=2818389 RepID=A0ABS3NDI7_9GAMM|nr:RNA polymerase sigma factor [Oceanisphaera pacifica]MBO1518615.1 RNA polymerase sigma factor [Oceanisphaera pacifica]
MSYPKNKVPVPLIKLTDVCLLERAQRGEGAAFELIVRRHNRSLFRAARGVLRDEGWAQEAVQEAYLSAFKNMDSYQGRASLKTWLTRIVINQAISIKRRQRPEVSLDENVIQLNSPQSEQSQAVSNMSDSHTPEAAVNQQEAKTFLEAAIRRLPENYRSVFMLRVVEEMSVVDSAYCLGITEAAVKKRLSRARAMLRTDLIQQAESQVTDTFEFAGKRCDAVTAHVMTELVCLGIVRPE